MLYLLSEKNESKQKEVEFGQFIKKFEGTLDLLGISGSIKL